MIIIHEYLLNQVSREAVKNPRKRQHYNFHRSYEELVQRLINACEPDSYFRPHNHSDSGIKEILLLLRGRLVVVIFNDDGSIRDFTLLSKESGCYGVELQPDEWHSTIALDPGTVMYEVKQGPFDENRPKVFAPWSAAEDSPEAKVFNRMILNKLGIR